MDVAIEFYKPGISSEYSSRPPLSQASQVKVAVDPPVSQSSQMDVAVDTP